jgi:ATP-dependent RNA helicase RhlE
MSFENLNLTKPLLNALSDAGFTKPTLIQEKAFSVIMSGRDVVGIAQTGTGKTVAYTLPCLRLFEFSKDRSPQLLIIVPTRELVVQVVEEVRKVATYMKLEIGGVYGGVNMKPQMDMVYNGVDVLVATPGRLLDLILNGSLKVKSVKRLIIDEMDELLDLGFRPQLNRVISFLPVKRQNLLFSATITDEIEVFIKENFNRPITVEAAATGTPVEKIVQRAYHLPNFYSKINMLKLLLKDPAFNKVILFTATKKLADDVYEQLEKTFSTAVGVIHSNKAQNVRFNLVNQFQSGEIRILIATDIIARGINISEVSHVINFDIPDLPETYMHRIGRTGRVDKTGDAISLISEQEAEKIEAIEGLMNFKIPVLELPEELVLSDQLTEDEKPKIFMKNVLVRTPKLEESGPSFHEKKGKNKKVNIKITRAEAQRLKYGKPKTRGQKKP